MLLFVLDLLNLLPGCMGLFVYFDCITVFGIFQVFEYLSWVRFLVASWFGVVWLAMRRDCLVWFVCWCFLDMCLWCILALFVGLYLVAFGSWLTVWAVLVGLDLRYGVG